MPPIRWARPFEVSEALWTGGLLAFLFYAHFKMSCLEKLKGMESETSCEKNVLW